MTLEVVILTRNRPELLLRCVTHLVCNNDKDFRLLILDSGENQIHRELIQALCQKQQVSLKYKLIEHHNLAHSKNVAIKLVKADHFVFLDDDQVPPLNWIKSVKKATHTGFVGIGGRRKPYYPHNYWNRIWQSIDLATNPKNSQTSFIPGGNSVYQTKFIKKLINFYVKKDLASEDLEMCFQIKKEGGALYFDESMWLYDAFRVDLVSFAQQWYKYGVGSCVFFRRTAEKKLTLPLMWKRYQESITFSTQVNHSNSLFFGYLVRNMMYLAGYLKGMVTPI